MATNDKSNRVVLVNGEVYVEGIQKQQGGGKKVYPRSYEQARELISNKLTATKKAIESLEGDKRVNSVVVTIKLNPSFLAKSYFPETLLNESGFKTIGSRRWTIPKGKSKDAEFGKMLFVQTLDLSLNALQTNLDRRPAALSTAFKHDIQKIEDITLLTGDEQFLGFPKNWKRGAVEIVLHPLGRESPIALQKLKRQLEVHGIGDKDLNARVYEGGLTFIAANLELSQLSALRGFNPLRTAHPIASWEPQLRSLGTQKSPKPSPEARVSSIKVGVFDGGAITNLPLLRGHVNNQDLVQAPAVQNGLDHGSCVAGAVLYGRLNDYGESAIVPAPRVFVESFRVLPSKNRTDAELYEAIDSIESVVPQRNDIKVYNISFGPNGPILDDDISRFTHVLDSLAYTHKVLFSVATGNDGDLKPPYNRLQSPSDGINNLGVGAWSYKISGKKLSVVRANYSCIGPGREGCKVKPDVVAFGGCGNHPFVGISTNPNLTVQTQGTSFSSPLVASLAAELLGRCDRINPLMARVLLIHSASHPNKKPDLELGHGCIVDSVEDIIKCDSTKVTILFQGTIRPQSYARLPIPFPRVFSGMGQIGFRWTLGSWCKPDTDNADEYSTTGIEDLFYPDSRVFNVSRKNSRTGKFESKKFDFENQNERTEAETLIKAGWQRSEWPVTDSVKLAYGKELERRMNFKWDSVVQRNKKKSITGVSQPFFILHALGRNGIDADESPVHYALAVTLECKKYQGDLYKDICAAYSRLEPLTVRAVNEVLISVPIT